MEPPHTLTTTPPISMPAPRFMITFTVPAALRSLFLAHRKLCYHPTSTLYSHGDRRLAPNYDLVCTLAWPKLSKNLAMKIGGCNSVNAFTIGDWKEMAKTTGLGSPMMRERMAESCHRVLDKLGEVQALTKEYNESMAILLHESIESRVGRMLEAFFKQGH